MTGRAEAPPGRGAELRSVGGVRIHYRVWNAPRPRSLLLLAHGLGEHSGRYASPAAELARRGITVFALDFRGHGLSGGIRGHARRFGDLVADLRALHGEASRLSPGGLPAFLLGHSLGGLIAARYLESGPEPPLRGAILSAPALGVGSTVPAWRRTLARLLSPLLPMVPAPNGIDPDCLSHDPREVAAYREDPLTHRWITPRLFAEMERAMQAAYDERARIRTPTLVLVPEADRVVDPGATLEFCRGMEFEVRRYPGLFHEPLHEVGRAEVLEELDGWIQARTG